MCRSAAPGSARPVAGHSSGCGATINYMVLAMSAGALRTYLAEHDALPATPLIAIVQVSLRDSDRRNEGGNDVGVLMCNLGTHLSEPAARLDTVRACMHEGKQALSTMSGAQVLAMSTLGAGPDVASMLLGHNARVHPPFDLIISDVPIPRNPRYWNSADSTRCTRSRSPSMGKDSTSPQQRRRHLVRDHRLPPHRSRTRTR